MRVFSAKKHESRHNEAIRKRAQRVLAAVKPWSATTRSGDAVTTKPQLSIASVKEGKLVIAAEIDALLAPSAIESQIEALKAELAQIKGVESASIVVSQ